MINPLDWHIVETINEPNWNCNFDQKELEKFLEEKVKEYWSYNDNQKKRLFSKNCYLEWTFKNYYFL